MEAIYTWLHVYKRLRVGKAWTEQQPIIDQGQLNQKHGNLSANS